MPGIGDHQHGRPIVLLWRGHHRVVPRWICGERGSSHARKIVFSGTFTTAGLNLEMEDRSLHIRNEGKVRKFVDQVEHVTFSGCHAKERGQDVTVVTERCVLQLGTDGWIVTEIAPGVDFDRDVQARCGFRLHRSSDMRSMDPSLFAPEPINLKLQPAT